MQESQLSLRERNRRETWATIHNVTATLVLETGWVNTTVEKVALKAGVSTRTFFNYFPSKEAAALGVRPLTVPDDALAAFHESDADIFDRTVKLIIAVMRTASPDDGLNDRRAKLIRDVPELRAYVTLFSATAGDSVEPILLEDPHRLLGTTVSTESPTPEQTVKIIRMIAGAMIRYALSQFSGSAAELNPEQLTETVATFRKVMQHVL